MVVNDDDNLGESSKMDKQNNITDKTLSLL